MRSNKSKSALYQGAALNTCAKNAGPEYIPYENLANAVVKQAVRDWQDAYIDIFCDMSNNKAKWRKQDCELFFHSEWYKMLTKIDGNYIINMAKKQVIENDYRRFWYHPKNKDDI